jgi:NADH-quinone oxidoreductase E subunit
MAAIVDVLTPYRDKPEMLLAALREVQDASGTHSINDQEMVQIAAALRVPLSKVYGVATFYSMYSVVPRGRHLIRVCESAPCHLRGAEDVVQMLEELLIVKMGDTTKDGRFTLEFSSCLGVCGVAPAIMVDTEVHGNLTRQRLAEILEHYQ